MHYHITMREAALTAEGQVAGIATSYSPAI